MVILLQKPVSSSWLSSILNLPTIGPELLIRGVCSLSDASPNCLTFTSETQNAHADIAIIAPPGFLTSHCCCFHALNPRLAFIRAFRLLELEVGFQYNHAEPKIHPSVIIGQNVLLSPGVEVGEGSRLYHNIVLAPGVKVGKHCIIKSGSIIGEEGFGFERDEDGVPIRMPHLGSVVIEDNVEVGSLVTVCRGSLSNTIIKSGVKIDDHCHIAHNVVIGKNTLVTAGVILSGSVHIGEGCWLAPNSTLLNKINVGDHAFIAIGSVVTKNVSPGARVGGNPARGFPSTCAS